MWFDSSSIAATSLDFLTAFIFKVADVRQRAQHLIECIQGNHVPEKQL
jgi:hypothetical protein